jgi:HAD superfamily phosphoserine phosphatase-like hydrolase
MRIACFDICGTLYFENTTFDFLDVYLADCAAFRRLQGFRRSLIGRAIFKLVYRLFSVDLARKYAIRCLRGRSREAIDSAAAEYVAHRLTPVEASHGRFRDELDRGSSVVLVSATIGPVATAIAHRLGVRAYSSQLAFDADGLCSGKLESDLLMCKREVVERLRKSAKEIAFYSDNTTDAPVRPLADEFFAVVHTEPQARFWARYRPTEIIRAR